MTRSDHDDPTNRLGYGQSQHRRRRWLWKVLLGAIGLPFGAAVVYGLALLWEMANPGVGPSNLGAAILTLVCFIPMGAVLGCVLGVILGATLDSDKKNDGSRKRQYGVWNSSSRPEQTDDAKRTEGRDDGNRRQP